MRDKTDEIKRWAAEGAELGCVKFSELPGIALYMDQVTALISDKLSFFENSPITSSMVNNYVKAQVIPHPEKKKYSREQVASLIAICQLKKVLSMQEIKTLFDSSEDKEALYTAFSENQTEAMNNVSAELRFCAENGDDLMLIAMKFAAEANAKRAAAEKILSVFEGKEEKKKK